MLEDIHPLKEQAKITDIWPCLSRGKNRRKSSFKDAVKDCMLNDIGLIHRHGTTTCGSIEKENEDPFLMLGYGINAYLSMLLMMFRMMCVLCIFVTPLYLIYGSHEFLVDQLSKNPVKSSNVISLGNMGGATIICDKTRIHMKKTTFHCPLGTFPSFEHLKYGVISNTIVDFGFCRDESIFKDGKNDDKTKCTDFIDKAFFDAQFRKCQQKNGGQCTIHFYEGDQLRVFNQSH